MDSVDYTFTFREKYLADQLEPEEKEAFEEELTRNPALLEALKEQIYLGNMLGEFLEETDTISGSDEEFPPTDNRNKDILPKKEGGVLKRMFAEPMKVAAVLAVLLLGGWALWNMRGPNEYQQIYAENYTHLSERETSGTKKGNSSDSSRDDELDPLLLDALKLYAIDDFEGSIEHLSEFIVSGRDSLNKGLFYRGLAYLSIGDSQEAIIDLQQYLESNTPPEYYFDAKWYLALSYLKEEQIEDALTHFNQLKDQEGPYKIRSTQISKTLYNSK